MLTCTLVGNGAVALASAQALLDAGHALSCVYSFDGSLRSFCEQRRVPHASSKRAFESLLLARDFDFLFSVNNPWILPRHVLRAARCGAINFHDSPLPRYAGLHATSWAILHGETEHATTWHEVTEEIDAGRIYECVHFPISPEDTALTVNTRVLELTLASLRRLIGRLARGDLGTTAQPDVPRTYFGRSDRPEAACTLDPTMPHAPLTNLVRALDFGHAPNPLGTPKLKLPGGFVRVSAVRRLGDASASAGSVRAVHDGRLELSVGDADVELSGLTALTGAQLAAADLRALLAGQEAVYPLSASEREAISAFNRKVCAYEERWVERLLDVRPARHTLTLEPGPLTSLRHERVLAGLAGQVPARLVAALAAYLVRTTRTESFDVGLSRSVPPAATALFADVVPLRVEVGAARANERFSELEARVIEQLQLIEKHGTFATDIVLRQPALKAQGAELPSFPIVVTQCESSGSVPAMPASAELWLCCFADGSAPRLASRGACGEAELEAIASQLTRVCAAAAALEDVSLGELPLLSDDERHMLLVRWNDNARSFPAATVHALISEQAQRTPARPAVSFGEQTLSYAELDARSNRLARALLCEGVRPGALVGLCLPRGVELVVALLAILKTGAAYVPIDPSYPEKRITYLGEDSGVKLVVTHSHLARLFAERAAQLHLDRPGMLARFSPERLAPMGDPEKPVYVIYTSGSTGNPKGAIISHRSLVNHSWALADKYGLGEHDRMLQSASISFDVAAEQIFPALFRGAEVVVRPDDLLESFSGFAAFVRAKNLTAMILPTAFWHEWVGHLESVGESVPASLRVLCVGTEKALGSRLDSWQRLTEGRVRFFEGYGPTETTITCTMFELEEGTSFGEHGEVPIGRALPNVELYVLDAYGRPAPVGVPGELYVGGAGVGLGYHQRPELTAERFLPNPFKGDGSRVYRTGDLVRYRPDGQLVYLGRIDAQVKIRGFRVELGEIEAAIAVCPGIGEVVVEPRLSARPSPLLVAYYVVKPGSKVDAGRLRAQLAKELPHYMMPGAFVELEHLPMTVHGKVDRRALPAPSVSSRPYAAKASATERQLAQLWQELLGREPIDRDEDFFELGGTSLVAIRLFAELERLFAIKLPMSTLLTARTIAKLAELVAAPEPRREGSLVELRPGDGPCLFLVHDADGETLLYANVARRLPKHVAVYGLEPLGRGRLPAVHTSVEAMAAHYVAEVRRRQPRGPYYLGGLCAGGVLSFEVARQLESQGEEVAVLALIESRAPGAALKTTETRARLARALSLVRQLAPGNSVRVARELRGKVQNLVAYELARRHQTLRGDLLFWLLSHVFRGGRGWPGQLRPPSTRDVYGRAEAAYVPGRVAAAKPLVFRAQEGEGDERPFRDIYQDEAFGWRELLDAEPQLVDVPGGHGECLQEPHAEHIARVLSEAFAPRSGEREREQKTTLLQQVRELRARHGHTAQLAS